MKKGKRILAAVTAAAMTLLIAPELGGEVSSQIGEQLRSFNAYVSAEETETVQSETEPVQSETEPVQSETEPVQSETEPVQSETETVQSETELVQSETEPVQSETNTDSTVTDDVAADNGISAQADVTVVDSGYCGNSNVNEGKNVSWTLSGDGVLTISGNGEMCDYITPEKSPWYSYKNDIVLANIGSGITYIGGSAFLECHNLTSITIPDSVARIGGGAFRSCSSLISITIPDGVTRIGGETFESCSSLTSITIPESVTKIYYDAFRGCSSLTSIIIPESVTHIGYQVFMDCSSLTSITIPNGVTSIDEGTFSGCTNLSSITIPESVTTIGYQAFEYCRGLTSITIPNGVTSINAEAFSRCSSLTNIIIPNSVTSINNRAFEYCSGLTSITIPDGVTSVGNGAFANCSSLTSITIPESVTYINGNTFKGCSSLTSITIPKCVTSIGIYAFSDCNNLKSITIPESVTSIGSGAFSGCNSLTSITIPNDVTSIGNSAFSGCNSLTSITIPNGVTSIGNSAFFLCNNLTIYGIRGSYAESYANENEIPFKELLDWGNDSEARTFEGKLEYLGKGHMGTGYDPNSPASYDYYALKLAEKVYVRSHYPLNKDTDILETDTIYYFTSQDLNDIDITKFINKNVSISGTIFESPDGCGEYVGASEIIFGEIVSIESDDPDTPADFVSATITQYADPVKVGDELLFTVVIRDNNGNPVNISDLSEELTYKTTVSNSECIRIDSESADLTGAFIKATAIGKGTATVTVTFANGVTASSEITVSDEGTDDLDDPIDEEAAKDYDFTAEIYMQDSKESIIYNVDTKKYNKESYDLSSYFNSSNGGKSIDGLKVVYTIADGFSFSADGKINVMNSLINSNYLLDDWEFSSEPLTVYPISNVDISELGYFSIIVKVYKGDKLIKNSTQRIPIKVTKKPIDIPDGNGIKITNENIDDFLDQNGDLVITEGEYWTSGRLSCNNLYVKGGSLSINGSLEVAGNAEVTGGKTNWFNPISQDVCGGILTIFGDLIVKGNMTVGTDSGYMEMTSSRAVVDVAGDFKITANSTVYRSKFTAGVLKIGGSFESSGKDSGNFKASGDHITHFYSNDDFTVKMNTENKDDDKNSYFNNLTFTDSAVNNFNGELYSFNVKGYFKKNDTKNVNYTKGEDLNNLFKDYIEDIDNAQKCLLSSYEELYNGNSELKDSLNRKLNGDRIKNVSDDWINKISADTEMFFQMSVMNKANDVNFDIGGNTISFRNFDETLVFKDVPFGKKSTVDIYVCLDVTGTGIVNSNASTAMVTWYAAGEEYYISGSAVLTFTAMDSLYSDLYEIYHSQAHEDDYWFWFKKVAEDFLDGMSGITGLDVKNAKTVIKVIDKCYKSIKTGKIDNPFEITAENVGAKMKNLTELMTGDNMLKVLISCPVDVEIRDSTNNVVGSIVDNRVIVSTNEVTMTAVGDKKYCTFNGQDNYSIKLTATGEGTMDYIIDVLNNDVTYRKIAFEKLPLSVGLIYTGSVECVSTSSYDDYKLTDNQGNEINATYDTVDLDGEIEPIAIPGYDPTIPNAPTPPAKPTVPSITTEPNNNVAETTFIVSSGDTFTVKTENRVTGRNGTARAVKKDNNITVTLGKKNDGYYANIYDSDGNVFDSIIIKNGKVKFAIPSNNDFYIIIDKESHIESEDVSSGAGIYELVEKETGSFSMLLILIAALGIISVQIIRCYQKNKR